MADGEEEASVMDSVTRNAAPLSSSTSAPPCSIIRIQELVQNRKQKYMFVVEVNAGNGDRKRLWRSYSDFFQLQCQLLDLFPEEAGQRNALTRIIPYLPGRKIFCKSSLALAQERKPQLELYLNDLLKLPSKLSKCKEIQTFLQPSLLDLELLHTEENSDSGDEQDSLLPSTEEYQEDTKKDFEYCFETPIGEDSEHFELAFVQ